MLATKEQMLLASQLAKGLKPLASQMGHFKLELLALLSSGFLLSLTSITYLVLFTDIITAATWLVNWLAITEAKK